MKKQIFSSLVIFLSFSIIVQGFSKDFENIEKKVIKWKRYFHQNLELSTREFNTAKKNVKLLKNSGITARENIIKTTDVIDILKGVPLRVNIEAFSFMESNNFPFNFIVKLNYLGKEVDVMHTCGHDTHIVILKEIVEISAKHKNQIKETVKFIFQSTEERVLKNPDVDAIFRLRISSSYDIGTISYKCGDKINTDVRSNTIPEVAEMIGTISSLDYDIQKQIKVITREKYLSFFKRNFLVFTFFRRKKSG